MIDAMFLNEYRCECGKLLLKGIFFDARLEIKCKKCGKINKIGLINFSQDNQCYVLIVNDKGLITNVSKSACDILGYECGDLIGKHYISLDSKAPKDIGKRIFGENPILNKDNYFQIETSHKSSKGIDIPVIIFLKLYKVNKSKYVVLSAKLKNYEEFDQNNIIKLSKGACDFYFDIDKNTIVTCVSPSFEKIFGLSQEEIIGKSYFDFLPEKLRKESKMYFDHFCRLEQPYRRENGRGHFINNKKIYYQAYYAPKFSDVGNFMRYSVVGWVKK